MNTAWPLVGRDEELAFMMGRLQRSAIGGAVLAGEAGCGKTRLALEFLENVGEQEFATILVIADRSTSAVPLAAFAQLLDSGELATDDPLRLLVQAREALERARGDRPLVLVVDDAQHLDPVSAAFVHQAAASIAFVVATVRSHEPIPEQVVALWKDGLADRIEIQPLAWPELHELLERALGGPVEGRTLHRLWTACRGNPMYLRELVCGGVDAGVLRGVDGTWVWDGALVAPRLVDLIGSRMATLSPDEQEALRIVALGEPLEVDVLESLADPQTIISLERQRLIATHDQGPDLVVRVDHPLYREVVAAEIPASKARETKRRLIEAIGPDRTTLPAHSVKVALWSMELGEIEDPDVLLEAAQRAADPRLMERLARAAVDAGGEEQAARMVASSLYLQARGEEAERAFSELAPHGCSRYEVTRQVDLRVGNMYFLLGRQDEAMELLESAESSELDRRSADVLRARRAHILLFAGSTCEAVELASGLTSDPEVEQPVAFHAAWIAGVGLALQGRADATSALVDGMMPRVEEATDDTNVLIVANLMTARYLAEWLAGELDGAEGLARTGYELLGSHPRSEMHGIAALGVARVALTRGRVRDAVRRFEESAVLLREYDTSGFLVFALSGLAQARALVGAVSEARDAIREAEHRRTAVRIFDADLELARAWSAAAQGDGRRAVVAATRAADLARDMDQHASEVVALHDAVRLGAGDEVAARLLDRARSVQGELAQARLDHARGVLDGDPEIIERASESFEAVGALILAAECASQAARLHLEAGRAQRSRVAAARARAITSHCQGARTPLLWPRGDGGVLTSREREMARLASQGLTNQAIADQLVVSVRTVENHLHQVYTKLGVAGRADLAAVLHDVERVAT